MKNSFQFILIILVLTFTSCSNNNSDTVSTPSSTWRLTEVLMDPGDGSGTFIPVQSNKVITFNDDNTVSCNGNLCDMSVEANTPTSGIYSQIGSYFTSSDCYNPQYQYQFQESGNEMIVIYPCKEPCLAKYIKE